MAKGPEDFTPDLRRLKSWPSMEHSAWRQPYLADLTYGELHRLVDEYVIGHRLEILELGCGNGFLSLELAREGHNVTGVDSDEAAVETAIRTMHSDPFMSERGRLDYELSDFATWEPKQEFDIVVVSRVLHHILRPEKILGKVQRLLREQGRIICVEFAYDQFDLATAKWFYQMRKTLGQAGWYESEHKLSDDPDVGAHQVLREWRDQRARACNRFEEMRRPLYDLFREEHFSWKPHLYWELIQHLRVPSNEVELEVARTTSAMERTLIETNGIRPVLFCFVGSKKYP